MPINLKTKDTNPRVNTFKAEVLPQAPSPLQHNRQSRPTTSHCAPQAHRQPRNLQQNHLPLDNLLAATEIHLDLSRSNDSGEWDGIGREETRYVCDARHCTVLVGFRIGQVRSWIPFALFCCSAFASAIDLVEVEFKHRPCKWLALAGGMCGNQGCFAVFLLNSWYRVPRKRSVAALRKVYI